jgi:hypothetical protein
MLSLNNARLVANEQEPFDKKVLITKAINDGK